MQSGQPRIPEVLEPQVRRRRRPSSQKQPPCSSAGRRLPRLLNAQAIGRGLSECSCPRSDARIAVVVGPEGGLTEREVGFFLEANPRASLVSLGSSILRTETAGVVAPALTSRELGKLEHSMKYAVINLGCKGQPRRVGRLRVFPRCPRCEKLRRRRRRPYRGEHLHGYRRGREEDAQGRARSVARERPCDRHRHRVRRRHRQGHVPRNGPSRARHGESRACILDRCWRLGT